jgi:hypothetical protein
MDIETALPHAAELGGASGLALREGLTAPCSRACRGPAGASIASSSAGRAGLDRPAKANGGWAPQVVSMVKGDTCPAPAVSNRVIVMEHQSSTGPNGKTASIPDRPSQARGAGIRPERAPLWVDVCTSTGRKAAGEVRVLLALQFLMPVFLLVMSPCLVAAESFFIEGSAKMHFYTPDGNTHAQATMLFTLSVKDCSWLLRFRRAYEGSNGAHAPDYQEISCDETNIYYISSMRSEVARFKASHNDEVPPNVANGLSYEGQVFHHRLADEVGAIWLAYASTCYFRSQSNNFIEPAMAFDGFGSTYEPGDHARLRAEWTLTDSEPNLPVQLVYFGDGYRRTRNGRFKLPAPYDRAFTNAIFQVQAYTNITGLRLPLESSLKVFTPRRDSAAAQDLRLLVEYNVHLTNASRTVSVASFRPELPGVTLLEDRRVGSLQYFATNGWPTPATLRTDAYFIELRAINTHASPLPRRSPWLPRVLLILIVLMPVAAYIARRSTNWLRHAEERE